MEAAYQKLPTIALSGLERLAIHQALQETGGNRTRAAERLGIMSRTLQRKLKGYAEEGGTVPPPSQHSRS